MLPSLPINWFLNQLAYQMRELPSIIFACSVPKFHNSIDENSKELQGTPKDSYELQRAPWTSKELHGPNTNSKKQTLPNNPKESKN